jgi:SnoaL-like domain
MTAILLFAFVVNASAQTPGEKAVQAFVEDFLLRLGDRKLDTVDADIAPKAIIVITRYRDNQWTNTYQTAEEWVAGLKRNTNASPFREPLTNVKVTIDSGQMAHLRGNFQILRDGKVQSKGVDQFTLVREPSGWKIAVLAITSLPPE